MADRVVFALPLPYRYFTAISNSLPGKGCAVSDIFNEVDEEVRREKLAKLWKQYGGLFIAVAVVAVVGVAGWRGYEYYEAKQAAVAGAQFDAAAELADQNKTADAEAAFGKLAQDGTRGYRDLARLRMAAEAGQRDAKAGIAAYDEIAKDSSAGTIFQQLAGVRAGLLAVDTASLDEMTKRLEPLAQATGAFRHTARELLALAAVRANDAVAAKRWFDMVTADADTPQSVRQRIDILKTLNGGSNS